MPAPAPTAADSGSSKWILLAVALVATVGLYYNIVQWMYNAWTSDADYSHGFLVPLFAAYILYANRRLLVGDPGDTVTNSGLWVGVLLIAAGLILRGAGYYFRVQTVEAVSLLPVVLGIFVLCLGPRALRWAWAPVLFLAFMIPLPGFLSTQLAGTLQMIATKISSFTLQLLGFTAFAEGNVISLSTGEIGVEDACSGLRMLYSFFALTAGACLLIDRTWIEKIIIVLCAIPIAILSNCVRIVVTGMAYVFTDPVSADKLHHFLGYLMMPLGFVFLLAVLALLDRILLIEQDEPEFA